MRANALNEFLQAGFFLVTRHVIIGINLDKSELRGLCRYIEICHGGFVGFILCFLCSHAVAYAIGNPGGQTAGKNKRRDARCKAGRRRQ